MELNVATYTGYPDSGVFCVTTGASRGHAPSSCETFRCAQDALLAGYRPCPRCRPLSSTGAHGPDIAAIVTAVEAEPERRWKHRDFEGLCATLAAAERQFTGHCGMTFVAYARARRLGAALAPIRRGGPEIQGAAIEAGHDVFSGIMGPVTPANPIARLAARWIETPLGAMVAIADSNALHLVEFADRRGLERGIERLRMRRNAVVVPGLTPVIEGLEIELAAYFRGELRAFETPLAFLGSEFQVAIWTALRALPYGTTCTYSELARTVGRPGAPRATGRANGANQLAIIVPCHRIVTTEGTMGGYGGGVDRKAWLIDHENRHRRQD